MVTGEVLETHLIKCKGSNKNNSPILPEDQEEQVIVKIYRSGESLPLCRYISGDSQNHCTIGNIEHSGFCPYRSFK